jgi:hypothetical protein
MPSKQATPSKPQRTIVARLSEEGYDVLMAFTDVHGTTIAGPGASGAGVGLRIVLAVERYDVMAGRV